MENNEVQQIEKKSPKKFLMPIIGILIICGAA